MQQYPPHPGMQPGMPMAGAPRPEHPQGTTILVLAILGIFLCPICSFVAWIMGNGARKQIAAGQYAESGNVTAGWIIGLIWSILSIIGILAYVLLAVVFVGALGGAAVLMQDAMEWEAGRISTYTLSVQIDDYHVENGEYPATLADIPGASTTDDWGNSYVYEKTANGYKLTCYGKDGAAGGTKINTDIVYSETGMISEDWTDSADSNWNWSSE